MISFAYSVISAIYRKLVLISAILLVILYADSEVIAENNLPEYIYSDSPFSITPIIDMPLLLSASVLWGGSYLLEDEISVSGRINDPDKINRLDKNCINYQSKSSRTAADVIFAAMITVPYGLAFYDKKSWGWNGVIEDAILISESLAFTGILNQLVRYSIRRPRPWVYREVEEGKPAPEGKGAFNSFFSGHVAYCFAASGALSTIFSIRYPDSSLKWIVWTASVSLGAAEGILRVRAGDHFWSDVIAGAVVGSAIGILIPVIHKRRIVPGPIEFILTPGGIGVMYRI